MKYAARYGCRVYGDNSNAHLDVAQCESGMDLIVIETTDQGSKEYYGNIRLALTKQLALILGRTLIKLSDEMKG